MIRPPPLPTRWALALFDDSRRTPDAPLRQRGTMLLPLGPARPGSGLTLIYPAALEKSLAALRRFIASSSSHSRSSPRLRSSIRRRARSWERRSALSLSLWAVVTTSRCASSWLAAAEAAVVRPLVDFAHGPAGPWPGWRSRS